MTTLVADRERRAVLSAGWSRDGVDPLTVKYDAHRDDR